MHRFSALLAALLLAQGINSANASDLNVGVSIAGEVAPGVYGRVDVGNSPPALVYRQPVVILRQPRPVAPIYMQVPPGHAKNWRKHCRKYDACGVPVYFVKTAEYEPRHFHRNRHEHHEHRGRHGHGHGRGHGHH